MREGFDPVTFCHESFAFLVHGRESVHVRNVRGILDDASLKTRLTFGTFLAPVLNGLGTNPAGVRVFRKRSYKALIPRVLAAGY